ncbi:MAG: transcriptional repressor [Cytophagales bacterium]|nr:MAG: transcriptional repressor [Cytophagales bacterium]
MNTQTLLKEFNLRNTLPRTCILDEFTKSSYALSHNDLENNLGNKLDRVTIYRTLKTFLENGILHKVLDDDSIVKYAICATHDCSHEQHSHSHVHFKCNFCGQTNCLNDIAIPNISLPKGYKFHETNVLINGICKDCNEG